MELNREQIVKALKCCSVYETCDGCPHFNGVPEDDCHYKAMANALSLIRELTEENKKLTINMNAYGLTARMLTEKNERLESLCAAKDIVINDLNDENKRLKEVAVRNFVTETNE